MTLGSPTAPVTLVEYIDLQCPICREFETTVMPDVIAKYVRTGKVKVEARVAHVHRPRLRARPQRHARRRRAEQGVQLLEVLYVNQGTENTGWLTDDMIGQIAASVPGMKVHELLSARNSSTVKTQGAAFDTQGAADKVPGTPTLYVGPSGQKGTVVNLKSADDEQSVVDAITQALP